LIFQYRKKLAKPMAQFYGFRSLVKPIVFFVLFVVAICIITGIWLCVNGKETLGASLITGSLTAVLSYAAGFGTSNFFKDEKNNKPI